MTVEQSTPTTAPAAAPLQPSDDGPPADSPTSTGPTTDPGRSVGFNERGRMRRRARFLRKARELAYRDLGGLVFNLHRFGQRNDALVMAKLTTLGHIDAELRTLETALAERQPVTVLRDAGIAACPRCAAIHGSEDRFCPNCGLAMDRHAERPVAGPPPAGAAPQPAPATQTPAPPPAQAPTAPTSASPPVPAQAPATQASAPTPASAAPAASSAPSASSTQPPSSTPAPSPATPPEHDPDQPTVIVRPPGSGV